MAAEVRLGDLGAMGRRAEGLRPLLQRIGIMLVARQQRAFAEQRRGRDRWPARAVPNVAGVVADLASGGTIKARRFQARPAGIDTGQLRASIAYEVRGTSVRVGSRLAYAERVHAGGTSRITVPRRIIGPLAKLMRQGRSRRRRERQRGAVPGRGAITDRTAGTLRLGFLFPLAKEGLPLVVTIPARPFATIERDDLADARRMAREWIARGRA